MTTGVTTTRPMQLWAFLENSDFQRMKKGGLYRQDEVRLIRHDEFLESDYELLVEIGSVGVRDAARWYVSHPAPGVFDWSWLDRVVQAAKRYKLELLFLDGPFKDVWDARLSSDNGTIYMQYREGGLEYECFPDQT
jgi:hypothetical protein